ncbi:MAG: hypothetical protein R3296_05215 [Oleiphilaceae bacterium]|nr:hypothetical protein [Oleiphilaceae bacterium]
MKHPPLPTLCCLLAITLMTSGCEENPITEGLLNASPPEEDSNNDGDRSPTLADFPDFEGVYDGETDTAVITGKEDALTLSVSAYRLWHMQNVLRSLDNLVRELVIRHEQDRPFQTREVLSAFGSNAFNCGSESAVSLENDGEEGLVTFNDFCVQGVARSDNHPYRLEGTLQWQDGRSAGTDSFGNQQPASREVRISRLSVQWRNSDYSLTGLSTLNDDGSQRLMALDTLLAGNDRQWRLLSVEVQNDPSRNERLIHEGRLGSMDMEVDDNSGWVTSGGTNCPDNRGAGGGRIRLFSEGSDNRAGFRMDLASCDLFNLLDGAQDSDGNPLPAGPFDLTDRL